MIRSIRHRHIYIEQHLAPARSGPTNQVWSGRVRPIRSDPVRSGRSASIRSGQVVGSPGVYCPGETECIIRWPSPGPRLSDETRTRLELNSFFSLRLALPHSLSLPLPLPSPPSSWNAHFTGHHLENLCFGVWCDVNGRVATAVSPCDTRRRWHSCWPCYGCR